MSRAGPYPAGPVPASWLGQGRGDPAPGGIHLKEAQPWASHASAQGTAE